MKRTLILIAMLTIGGLLTTMAAPGKSSILKFGLFNDRPFTYSINGQHWNQPVREAKLQDIAPGRHHLTVFGPGSHGYGRKVLFKGEVLVRPHSVVSGEITPRGEFYVERVSQRKHHNGHSYNPNINHGAALAGGNCGPGNGNAYGNGGNCGPGNGNGNAYGHGNGNGYGQTVGSCGTTPQNCGSICGNTCSGACGGDQYYGHFEGYNAGGGHNRVMSQGDFRELIRTVDAQRFASTKMIIAKEAIQRNNLTSAQARELAARFRFDSDRLEIAKFAFHSTVDPQNYFIVNQVFTFDSSVEALNRYIRA